MSFSFVIIFFFKKGFKSGTGTLVKHICIVPIASANHNFVVDHVYLVDFLLFQKTPTAKKPIMTVRAVSTKTWDIVTSMQG